jgi:hypothetical protein
VAFGGGIMAKSLAAAPTAHRCFSVLHTESSDWIVRERRGAVERSFPSQKAAVHFVLFELGAYAPAALLTPRSERVAGDEH